MLRLPQHASASMLQMMQDALAKHLNCRHPAMQIKLNPAGNSSVISTYNICCRPTTSVCLTTHRSLLESGIINKLGFQLQGVHKLFQPPIPVDCLQVNVSSVVRRVTGADPDNKTSPA